MPFVSHKAEHDAKFNEAVEKALRLVGGAAERRAKETISDMDAVDTGLLRNSITWAVAGQPANTGSYHADTGEGSGSYGGTAPSDGSNPRSVYVGTNVEYAPYVEYGTYKMRARPFLANSIQNFQSEFQEIFKEAFHNFF